jgi:mono/diheme cytochrome c family protein
MFRLNQRSVVLFLLMSSLAGSAGLTLVGEEKPKLKKEPAKYTSPASGAEMYKEYCASCHGVTGKGDGPAAPALKSQPADLTTIARHNGGKFPTLKVQATLDGKASVVAHGSSEMPVWGTIFRQLTPADEAKVLQRTVNLTKHVESMQVK